MSKVSAVDQVINQVKSWILNNTYKSGAKLPSEGEICAICQVSRGSVREAMKVLSTIGLVTVRRGDGTYISSEVLPKSSINPLHLSLQKSYYSSKELMELRECMENSVVSLIIANASDNDIDSLFELNRLLEESVVRGDKLEVQVSRDMDFHKRMGAITNNILMSILYAKIIDFIEEDALRMYGQTKSLGKLSVMMHYNICKALKKRNLKRAQTEIHLAMQNHVKENGDVIADYIRAEEELGEI